ncbi:MAG: putative F420-0 ABC transporter substrate-binding protein [Cryobacterium sp.]|nr:putative F420-0 ABC transporter substrate-binding protein [Cryobacterium sp.]
MSANRRPTLATFLSFAVGGLVFRRGLVLCLALATVASLAACSQSSPATTLEPRKPVSIVNCGFTVPLDSPPKRVITIKSTSTEMLLALGLGDRIVGTAFQDGPLPKSLEPSKPLPVLAEKVPSEEVVLNATPDFVYAGWESNFSADGAGTREDLAGLGIRTYVSPAACKEPQFKPEKLSFEEIESEIRQIAQIFGVDPSEVIKSQRSILKSIHKDNRGLTALWFSSGSDTPYVGAGIGAPQLIMDTIGLQNIAADIKDTWSSFSWESVIAADPDVIVLVDASWSSMQKKIGVLESNPATAKLKAVREHRYLIVPFAASEAGVRTASAAADLAKQLAALP